MSHQTTLPFTHTSGSLDSKIALVGEAWNEDEERCGGIPFFGWSGQELTRLLNAVGIARSECFLTNVFNLRPPSNNIERLCVSRKEAFGAGVPYKLPPLIRGQFLDPQYVGELDRLKYELENLPELNVVIALGVTACWALLGTSGISVRRGTIAASTLCPAIKVLPTFQPSYIVRMPTYKPIILADLQKAKSEMAFKHIKYPEHRIKINPTLQDMADWFAPHFAASMVAVDIETVPALGHVTCIGFAASTSEALAVPFWLGDTSDRHYWPTQDHEIAAWRQIKNFLELSPSAKLFHNGIYDLQYIVRMGIRPRNCIEDTMLWHHSLYPEMPKKLGFLGSIYTDNVAWKLLNAKHGEDKADE